MEIIWQCSAAPWRITTRNNYQYPKFSQQSGVNWLVGLVQALLGTGLRQARNLNSAPFGDDAIIVLIQRADWPARLRVRQAVKVLADVVPLAEMVEGLLQFTGFLVRDAEVQVESVDGDVEQTSDAEKDLFCL